MKALIVHKDRIYFSGLPDIAKDMNVPYKDVYSVKDLIFALEEKPDLVVFDNNLKLYSDPSFSNLISYIKKCANSYTVLIVDDRYEIDGINGVRAGADCYLTESNLTKSNLEDKINFIKSRANLTKDIKCLEHITKR